MSLPAWLVLVLQLPVCFSAALLCGMVFRRGITAVVIGLVLSIGLLVPLFLLTSSNLLPELGVLAVPVALFAVSWAWSGDWMLDRPAPGRWLRLGLLLAAAFGILFACYVSFRLWSVRDVGPIAPPAVWTAGASDHLPNDRNAAGLYVEAGNGLSYHEQSQPFLERNAGALALIRRAAALPDCRFTQPVEQTLFERAHLPPFRQLAGLVVLEARDRLAHEDLSRAWDDIVVLLRMARHFGQGVQQWAIASLAAEREALGLAIDWANARGQTPERLGAALAAYRELPRVVSVTDALRAEAKIIENTLDRPTPELREYLEESVFGRRAIQEDSLRRGLAGVGTSVVLTPWELARARRVNRLVAAWALGLAAREPGERPSGGVSSSEDEEVRHALETTPRALASVIPAAESFINTDDRNEVGRRALIQILAIRQWQLRHDGRLPDDLHALVPEELPSLPKDPYSGGPFHYAPARGQTIFPGISGKAGSPAPPPLFPRAAAPGSWLLYSVGPNRIDDGGTAMAGGALPGPGDAADIVFGIPTRQEAPGAEEEEGQERQQNRPAPGAPRRVESPAAKRAGFIPVRRAGP
jgi:hypothetical protein